jgi:MFS family permease
VLNDGGPRRTFWLLFGATLLCFLSIGAYAPTLPSYVEEVLDGGPGTIGVVTGITAVAAILFRPAAGAFGDRRGRRRAAFFGAGSMALGPALLLLSHAMAVVLLARLAIGVGEGLLSVASMAWIIDATPEARRGRALGIYGTAIWLGLGLGPQFAAVLEDQGGFDAVWTGCVACGLLAGALVACAPRAPRVELSPDTGWIPRIPRGALAPGAVVALALCGDGVLNSFGVIHLVARGVPGGAGFGGAASIFTVFAVTAFAIRAVGGGLADRYGAQRCGLVATVMVAIGWAIVALASSFAAATVGTVFVGAGMALLYPAMGLLVAARVPAADRGAGLGAFMAFMDIGFGIGAVGGGIVVGASSTAVAFWLGALAAVGAAVMLTARWARVPTRAVTEPVTTPPIVPL